MLVSESAPALARLGDDNGALVLSSRRLVEHHPASGPLAWLCARVLCGDDARGEAWRCADEISEDATAEHLVNTLPDEATVVVLGWPEVGAGALAARGDVRTLVVNTVGAGAAGAGAELALRLAATGNDAVEVPESGTAAAVRSAEVVMLEASALGSEWAVATAGSYAAAAVARHAGVAVWLVAGVGRALPPKLWSSMSRRLVRPNPWMGTDEVVPLDLVETVVRPRGAVDVADLAGEADCPEAPELR